MSIKQSILVRVKLAFILMAIVGFFILSQIANIQFVQGSHWQQRAKEISLQYRVKKATRGTIYGENNIMLATSVPLYRLAIDPMVLNEKIEEDRALYSKKLDSLVHLLVDFFQDETYEHYIIQISDAIKAKKRFIVLNKQLLTYADKQRMSEWPIFREGQNQGGVIFDKVNDRTYPFQELAARTIGHLNQYGVGAGIEKSFNTQLEGVEGRALYRKIAGDQWKPIQNGSEIRPIDGYDVYTTLNINMQEVVHQNLEKSLIQHDANYGCAIVMDVKTGEIKAMANLGRVKPGEYQEDYNYAIGSKGSDDPGSTFKVASMMALLEDTTLTLNDSIETGGGTFRYYDQVMRDTRYGGWGKITIQQALEQSSNVGVSKLITRHFGQNPDRYVEYLKGFELARPLNSFNIDGLVNPYIKDTKDPTWSGVTLPWMSVGYEMKVSPLQLVAFFNAIANNGTYIEPVLIKKVTRAGEVIEEFSLRVREKPICSPQTLQKLKAMLEGVVLRGTAKRIQSSKFKIAGKTGTSQKLNRRGEYIRRYKTSFVGYFPADKPKYTCIVVVDQPRVGGQSGGEVAAPIFRKIADRLYTLDVDVQTPPVLKREAPLYKTNLPKNQPGYSTDFIEVCNTLSITTQPKDQNELVSPIPRRYTVEWENLNLKSDQMPDVRGLSLRDALYVLENRGLKVKYTGRGKVKNQSLRPGSGIKKGQLITIELN